MHSTVNLLRTLFVTFTICVGLMVGSVMLGSDVQGAMAGGCFGLAVVLADRLMHGITLRVFSSATFGLLVGFVFAQLLLASRVLAGASAQVQWLVGLITYSTFGYLGMMLAVRSNRDEFALIIPYVRFRQAKAPDAPVLADHRILLESRLPALLESGFIGDSLIVPQFALDQLQMLADSSDRTASVRGRAAIERLHEMQRDRDCNITIHATEPEPETPPEARLLKLAQLLEARLLTTDAQLCATARLQNISALNFDEFDRAMRPQVTIGDETEISLVKEGRDPHQAVGFLADGTMIVVNHARAHLGKTRRVVIGGSLQTSAGRLYFAELKSAS